MPGLLGGCLSSPTHWQQQAASGFTDVSPATDTAEAPNLLVSSPAPTNGSHQETLAPVVPGSTSPYPVSGDSTGATTAVSETTVNFTSTSGTTLVPESANSSVQSQTSPDTWASSTTTVLATTGNTWTSSVTSGPSSAAPGIVSGYSPTSTSPEVTWPTGLSTSSSPPAPGTIQGEIKCAGIKEVKLTHSICLELNKTASCEDFKKDRGEDLVQMLCGEEAGTQAGAGACSLLLAQSEVKPQCLLLVLANSTELSRKLDLFKKHQFDLEKLGIQSYMEQDVGSHQNYSRKTLIALVTSGILLAILGTTGYFLMNRRSWSPAGERLGEDPYYTENSGGQGYSSGPGASSEAQGKASVNRGAQENGTGQATSRNGHSARQHVADTEL
ncbi:Hematopoietic progenitor cell antigen CD34 [Fukomys damarensis]|uniref:Hematopoietic progenitor cell antigen CD34 n=1 Tax=Fukomys damarensis TaxID=885580 RepID=A0A091DA29_FUKDA|nr:Hematopoietic progenitor cell antigen CD34 [Fukomys damarensis]